MSKKFAGKSKHLGSGKLLMDFNILREGNQIHVLNAPSPGATASLAIADHILSEYLK